MRTTIRAILTIIAIIIALLLFCQLRWWMAKTIYGDGTCAVKNCVIVKEDL